MKPGESVEQALAQYEYDTKFFSEQLIAQADRSLTGSTDQRVREALQRDKEVLSKRLESARSNIQVIGVDLFGTPRALSAYSKQRDFIRAIEVKTPNRIESAIRPQD